MAVSGGQRPKCFGGRAPPNEPECGSKSWQDTGGDKGLKFMDSFLVESLLNKKVDKGRVSRLQKIEVLLRRN